MSSFFKEFSSGLLSLLNLTVPRAVNGRKVMVPVMGGTKVGVSGEKWMSGILSEIFRYSRDGVFYDVGINLGQTLVKVKTINPEIGYVGFEPNPSCLSYLDRLVALNSWHDVKIVPAGLSDVDGVVPLFGNDGTDPESTIVSELRHDGQNAVRFVPVFRYETLRKQSFDEKVGVLKIDVEGAELEVVRSLQVLIACDRPIIVMEVLPNSIESQFKARRNREMLDLIASMDYDFYRIMKTELDTYRGIAAVDDVGDYTDPVMKDHVFVPREQVQAVAKLLSVVPFG